MQILASSYCFLHVFMSIHCLNLLNMMKKQSEETRIGQCHGFSSIFSDLFSYLLFLLAVLKHDLK